MSEPDSPTRRASSTSDRPGDLVAVVRHKLATGALPKEEEARLMLNLGLVRRCDACGSPITFLEHVAELHDGREFRFHALCIETWQRERGAGGDQVRLVTPQPDWEGHSPEVSCTSCGLRIQPFDARYVVRGASYHPKCYAQRTRENGAAPQGANPPTQSAP